MTHTRLTQGKSTNVQRQKAHGFTLVETLVAITVLLVAIVGPMTIAAQGLQASFFAREQATAIFLAQEAIESIQSLRDEDAIKSLRGLESDVGALCLSGVLPASPGDGYYDRYPEQDICDTDAWAWFDAIEGACVDGTGCDYDVVGNDFIPCDTETACILLYDQDHISGHYYQYVEGDTSQFRRTIWLSDIESNQEVSITVEVSWGASLFGGETERVVLQSRIFNQYE